MHRSWWAFIRLFFRSLYNECAWTYDLVAWMVSLGQWTAWGRTAIPHLQGEWVLELAHGPGHLLVAMAERGLAPVGLDLSPHMGRLARLRLRRAKLAVRPGSRQAVRPGSRQAVRPGSRQAVRPGSRQAVRPGSRQAVPLVQARAQVLPFDDGCMDSVVATFPTEFILDPATLQEVARVLRPGGRLVVVAWARLEGRDPLSRFIGWLYRVTGQGEPPPGMGEAALIKAGFVPYAVRERVGRSQVLLVVADKR